MFEKIGGKRENVYNHTKRWNQKYLSNEITIRKIDLSKRKSSLSNQLRLQIHIMTITMHLVHEPTQALWYLLGIKKERYQLQPKSSVLGWVVHRFSTNIAVHVWDAIWSEAVLLKHVIQLLCRLIREVYLIDNNLLWFKSLWIHWR